MTAYGSAIEAEQAGQGRVEQGNAWQGRTEELQSRAE